MAMASQMVKGRSQNVRDAVRVARLAPSLGVKRAISLLLPGGEGGMDYSHSKIILGIRLRLFSFASDTRLWDFLASALSPTETI